MWFAKKIQINTDEARIQELLSRCVEDAVVRESLEAKLKSGKPLRIKLGIDPTSPDLHIGHAVVLRKLRAFQDLGHTAVLIIGDFTATIGDPTGKSKTRPHVSEQQIKINMREYVSQASKIIDIKKAEIKYNSKWLKKLPFSEIFRLSGLISLTQMLERNDFSNRIQNQQSIRMHELFYPLMQAYDSVHILADVELGGNDQLFNNLTGRTLMERLQLPPQDVLTMSLLVGLDGKEKMSKSLGNYIGITDQPSDMYGKVMSLRDEAIPNYFTLATDAPAIYVKEIEDKLKMGENPKEFKMELAREIVALYHGKEASLRAEAHFISVFSKGHIPEEVKTVTVQSGAELRATLVDTLILPSRAEFVRLLEAGAIMNMNTGEKVEKIQTAVTETAVYKIGKKQFVKIVVS